MENARRMNALIRTKFMGASARLKENLGATAIRSLLIFLIVMMLIAFGLQVFMIYTTSAAVHTTFQNAMIELASRNSYTQEIFEGMREFQLDFDNSSSEANIMTYEEFRAVLMYDLGLIGGEDNSLVCVKSDGQIAYTIENLSVSAAVRDETNYTTVIYTAYFELVMPVASYWNYGTMIIPMQVESMYRAKV